MPWSLALDLGSRGAWPALYETPLTKVRVSLGEVMPLLGERLDGVRSGFGALVPFSCGYKKVVKGENGSIILKRLRSKGACVCVCFVIYTFGSAPAWFSFWGKFCLLWDSARDM